MLLFEQPYTYFGKKPQNCGKKKETSPDLAADSSLGLVCSDPLQKPDNEELRYPRPP